MMFYFQWFGNLKRRITYDCHKTYDCLSPKKRLHWSTYPLRWLFLGLEVGLYCGIRVVGPLFLWVLSELTILRLNGSGIPIAYGYHPTTSLLVYSLSVLLIARLQESVLRPFLVNKTTQNCNIKGIRRGKKHTASFIEHANKICIQIFRSKKYSLVSI